MHLKHSYIKRYTNIPELAKEPLIVMAFIEFCRNKTNLPFAKKMLTVEDWIDRLKSKLTEIEFLQFMLQFSWGIGKK